MASPYRFRATRTEPVFLTAARSQTMSGGTEPCNFCKKSRKPS